MSLPHEIKGWCPTALRPMESGDGLLIRPKVIGARIDAAQLGAIARIANTFGNGLIDLTQRAQLQIRGVRSSTLKDALLNLEDSGLLAANAGVERIVNILMPPLAGIDQSAIFDSTHLVSDLSTELSRNITFHELPAKFLFAVVDGGVLPIDFSKADISIHPAAEGRLALCLAGVEDAAIIVPRHEIIASTLRLAKAYIELRTINPFEFRRMGRLIRLAGAAPLIEKAGLELSRFTASISGEKLGYLGSHTIGEVAYAGVAASSGRWNSGELAAIARLAIVHGLNEARLTPWRAILFPAHDLTSAIQIETRAKTMGLIVDANDPRRSVIACPGAPDCSQSRGETRRHVERLAPLARHYAGSDGVGLHISGCGKGCARQQSTPVTLVLDRGRFDIVFDGAPHDKPTQTHLTLEEVERIMTRDIRINAPCPAI